MKMPHPHHQVVFSPTATSESMEVQAELDMLVDASAPCMNGYTVSEIVEDNGGTVTLYVVAYVSDIAEFMRRVAGSEILTQHLL